MATFKIHIKCWSNYGFKIKATFFFIVSFWSCLGLFSQELSGVWLGNGTSWQTNVCNIEVATSVSDIQNGASVSFSQESVGCNISNTYTSTNIIDSPALGVLTWFGIIGTGTGILTFSFSEQVHNPILHIDKIGGRVMNQSNSVLLTVVDPDLSLTRLSGNGIHFEVTSTSITRALGITTSGTECGTLNEGTAAGSVQINGAFSEVSFQFQLSGTNGNGDLMEFVWEVLSCDFDGDGVFDTDDLDDDNDGILDTVELNGNPLLDTDGDGMIDSLDIDSDGDGCVDAIEAGFNDPEMDGVLGALPDDVDDDGLIINEPDGYTTPLDIDANGVAQFQENERQQIILQPESVYTTCEQDNITFNVSILNPKNIQWQMSTDLGVTWTDLENDTVFSGVNSENLTLFNVPLSFDGYWFRASDQFCKTPVLTEITKLTVLRIPDPGLDGDKIFCVGDAPEDLLLSLGGTPDTNGIWTPVLTSESGVFNPAIDSEGIYTYTVDNGFCPQTSTVNVLFSEAPLSVTVDVVDNSYNNSITVNAEGIGDYEYAIDGLNYQDSNVFGNLKPDVYTIYVRDKKGCGAVFELEVEVLGYPKYFTPNADGFNDIWNVRGVSNTNYTIYIYDRYGKLLKSYKESYPGWDGTFNNQNMPATDYWFDFVTSEGRVIKGHFALKR